MTRFFHVQLSQRWHYWWQIQVHRHQTQFYQTNNHPKNKHKMLNKYHFIPSAYVNSAQQSSLMYWFFSYNRCDRILIKAKLLSLATYILKKFPLFGITTWESNEMFRFFVTKWVLFLLPRNVSNYPRKQLPKAVPRSQEIQRTNTIDGCVANRRGA